MFLTNEGFPLSRSAFAAIIWRLKVRSGIPRFHAHLVRHTALTLMVEREIPAFVVQQIAGHASIQTTEIYVHLAQMRTNMRYQQRSVVDGIDGLRRNHGQTQNDRPRFRRKEVTERSG